MSIPDGIGIKNDVMGIFPQAAKPRPKQDSEASTRLRSDLFCGERSLAGQTCHVR